MNLHALSAEEYHLVNKLPFKLDDYDRLGKSFEDWRQTQNPLMESDLQLWIYCFVRRFLLAQFLRYSIKDSEQFERLLEQIYFKCWAKMSGIENPKCLAAWVLQVSKNTFKNHLRDYNPLVMEELNPTNELLDEQKEEIDFPVVISAVRRAIRRLPKHQKRIARLRFIEEMDYEDISYQTGMKIPSVRAYCHKISKFLKEDIVLSRIGSDFLNDH